MLWDCHVQVRRQDTRDGDGRQGGARPRVQVSQGAGDYGGSRSPHLHIEYQRPTLQVLDEARGCVLIMQRFTRKGEVGLLRGQSRRPFAALFCYTRKPFHF